MSYLFNTQSSWEVDEHKLKEAQLQFDSMSILYQRIIDSCEQKCVERYGEPELTKGELCCIDRCVSKYMTANQTVGYKMKELNVNPMFTNAGITDAVARMP